MSAVSLRPYLASRREERCAEIFRSSIEELAAEDYRRRAARGLGGARRRRTGFRRAARRALTLLAVIDGAVAGFASLKGADEIDMLFVDPEFARQGAGRHAGRRA